MDANLEKGPSSPPSWVLQLSLHIRSKILCQWIFSGCLRDWFLGGRDWRDCRPQVDILKTENTEVPVQQSRGGMRLVEMSCIWRRRRQTQHSQWLLLQTWMEGWRRQIRGDHGLQMNLAPKCLTMCLNFLIVFALTFLQLGHSLQSMGIWSIFRLPSVVSKSVWPSNIWWCFPVPLPRA